MCKFISPKDIIIDDKSLLNTYFFDLEAYGIDFPWGEEIIALKENKYSKSSSKPKSNNKLNASSVSNDGVKNIRKIDNYSHQDPSFFSKETINKSIVEVSIKHLNNDIEKINNFDDFYRFLDNFIFSGSVNFSREWVLPKIDNNSTVLVYFDRPYKLEDAQDDKKIFNLENVLLHKILSSVGITKYTISYFSPWLHKDGIFSKEEIEILTALQKKYLNLTKDIFPKIKNIICLGTLFVNCIVGGVNNLKKLRSATQIVDGFNIFTTYPLTSLIATPIRKKEVWLDFIKIAKYLNE